MTKSADRRDAEDSLAIRAAGLHYVAGQTQADVASRLGVTSLKAHRLIMRANQSGAVKFTIDGDVAECAVLESRAGPERRRPAVARARFRRIVIFAARNSDAAGWRHRHRTRPHARGRRRNIPRMDAGTVRFVSLLGGVTRKYTIPMT